MSVYEEIYDEIEKSNLFDKDFYLLEYDDVRESNSDPIEHYIKYGREEGRRPNSYFDEKRYITYFDKEKEDLSFPFLHFLRRNNGIKFADKGLLGDFSFESIEKIVSNINKIPFFSCEDYEEMNSDTKGGSVSSDIHAVIYGIPEGRRIFSPKKIAETFGILAKEKLNYIISNKKITNNKNLSEIVFPVFYHSKGNTFIREIAEDFSEYMRSSGFKSIVVTEEYEPNNSSELYIFCAPHEFFFLNGSEKWKEESIISSSIMLNTEQPQTDWFNRGVIYLFLSLAIIDFSYQTYEIFKNMGIRSFHFDPIVSTDPIEIEEEYRKSNLFKILPEKAKKSGVSYKKFLDRSIDVSFFGNDSRKRDKFLSKNALYLSEKNCFIYYRKNQGPIPGKDPYKILSKIPSYVADNSKISINIHRDEDPYFEWHRIVKQGLSRGSIVVSEECLPHPLYKEGVNFLVETSRHMPNLIEWLLNSEDGHKKANEIQEENFKMLNNKNLLKSKNIDLINFINNIIKEL
ncbi:hypothetical protein LOC54_11785 [Acetobacter sp. AN02]|uniref:hypothetical protein n=1 Tax=Acetobacter sp. AN02 TaxID=2894186 RepID=UPI00243450CC|nr:hypothetical protein [Acetobacter sp. AN02]MDG6095751.1 hypothetical protein [Acetobacter sp. AN02]